MEKIRLIGRNSRLSLLQIEQVKERIARYFPETNIEIIARESRGDILSGVPLQTVEGMDFFTQDIYEALEKGEADIAVHSLKDLSYEHFSGSNRFAVTDREDRRDVAIFRKAVIQKLERGHPILIGTCSPRREEMAMQFLQKALPQLNSAFRIETKFIRGNVDTRLRKLDQGEYDGIILATAGLNRLLANEKEEGSVHDLLKEKLLMVLPLIECVPAPCQGAIVAEAHPDNKYALAVLDAINDQILFHECVEEKMIASKFGKGCLQKFGVTTIYYDNTSVVYAGGRDANEKTFSFWHPLPEIDVEGKNLFSSTDFMGNFFKYDYNVGPLDIQEPIVYVANYKVIKPKEVVELLKNKRVWAAGTKTWFEMARKGIWVEGSADALGLETLKEVWVKPLLNIDQQNIRVLTHEEAEQNWQERGWKTCSSYRLEDQDIEKMTPGMESADLIFWTSFRQYQLYKKILKQEVLHLCPSGETATLLRDAGLEPVVFPTIKAFNQWRETFSRSHNAA